MKKGTDARATPSLNFHSQLKKWRENLILFMGLEFHLLRMEYKFKSQFGMLLAMQGNTWRKAK
jgi:hypothetical protein